MVGRLLTGTVTGTVTERIRCRVPGRGSAIGHPAVRAGGHFPVTDSTQPMKFVVGSPVRSASVWPWAQTVAKSTSRMP